MTTVFEYKNSRLSVVEGAPEKPKQQSGEYNLPFEKKMRKYEQALASCRRIPVAEEDEKTVVRMIFDGNLLCFKDGELYNVDVETENEYQVKKNNHSDWIKSDEESYNDYKVLTGQAWPQSRVVARIKQKQVNYKGPVYGDGLIDQVHTGEKKTPVTPTMVLPSLNAEQEKLLNASELAIKNVPPHLTDPTERLIFISAWIASYNHYRSVKPVVASTEDQEEQLREDLRLYGVAYIKITAAGKERLDPTIVYTKITRNPKQP